MARMLCIMRDEGEAWLNMNLDKFKNDLMLGETSSIEFKRCGTEVEHDVFESI